MNPDARFFFEQRYRWWKGPPKMCTALARPFRAKQPCAFRPPPLRCSACDDTLDANKLDVHILRCACRTRLVHPKCTHQKTCGICNLNYVVDTYKGTLVKIYADPM